MPRPRRSTPREAAPARSALRRPAALAAALALALVAQASAPAAQSPAPKQVCAPPSDVTAGVVRLPARHVERSAAAWLPLVFERADEVTALARVPLAGPPTTLALVGGDVAAWEPSLALEGGAELALRDLAVLGTVGREVDLADGSLARWTVETFTLDEPLGNEAAVVVRAPLAGPDAALPGPAFLAVADALPVALASTVEGRRWTSEREIPVTARLEGAPALVEDATLELAFASGTLRLPMTDDGLGPDAAAADGVFSAAVPPGLDGDVTARVTLAARAADGTAFERTAWHALQVLPPSARLLGEPRTSVQGPGLLALDLDVAAAADGTRLQLSFELWGRRPEGRVPVVWSSRMSGARAAGVRTVRFLLDTRWLDRAGTASALELRAVRLQDPDTHVVLDARERLPLAVAALPPAVGAPPGPVTREMLLRPAAPDPGAATTAAPTGSAGRLPRLARPPAPARSLVLSHGYCSGGSVWPDGDFSEPKDVFMDPNAARSNDAFAQLIAAFAEDRGLDSFGVVAHSQGGCAALHLYTFYQSGLDLASGPRRIQSVATPYQGTPLASLGFFACGTVADLTPSGAAAWLSTIPSFARAEVSYWTVSNAGAACEPLANLFITNPNDGTVEQFRGQLPGASNMGHTLGWCHTTGMSEPPCYTDAVRNAEMDARAAR